MKGVITVIRFIKKRKIRITETTFHLAAVSIVNEKKNLKSGYLLNRFYNLGDRNEEAM